MIYVISKSTCGEYGVRDIQCNANWTSCPYSDYARIPDELVEGILATQGYCDITLNDAGTAVESFTAREIPSVPRECCGLNTVLSVNGAKANSQGEIYLPKNMLDNSNFASAINQRGEDEYYGTSGYTIDRWRAVSSLRVTVASDCITIKHEGSANSAFTQYLGTDAKLILGETYTAAIKLKDNPVVWGSVTKSEADYDMAITLDSGTTVRIAGPTDRLLVMVVPGDVLNIEWIALYQGEYTADTLPEYQPKGYAEELMTCERYFRVFRNGAGYVSASNAYIFSPLRMRTTPTATVKEIGSIRTQGKSVTPKSVSGVTQFAGGSFRLTMPGEYGSANYAAELCEAKIWLSADLGEG